MVDYDWRKKQYVGRLAESWEVKDPLTWVFHLRQGARFHDGSSLTSADVLYSYNRIRTDRQSRQHDELRDVASMETPDSQTFVLRTSTPQAPFLSHLVLLVIQSAAAAKKYGSMEELDRHPTGTGSYKFVSWERGQQFILTRNDDYWRGKPQISGGAFKPIPETQARLTALQTGALQLMTNLPYQDVAVVQRTTGLRVATARGGRIMFLGMQPHVPPLSDKRVRQAINYAVDVDQVIKSVLGGRAYRANQPITEQYLGYDPEYKGYPHDPDRAKALLRQAGYPNGFDIVLHSPNGEYAKDLDVAQALAGQMQQVGIRCTVQTAESGAFSEAFERGRYSFWFEGRGSIYDPDVYIGQYFRTGTTPRLGYSNPQVDALIQQQREAFDLAKRAEILKRIGRLIMDDAAIVPLFNYENDYGVISRLEWKPLPDESIAFTEMKWIG